MCNAESTEKKPEKDAAPVTSSGKKKWMPSWVSGGSQKRFDYVTEDYGDVQKRDPLKDGDAKAAGQCMQCQLVCMCPYVGTNVCVEMKLRYYRRNL